MQRIFKFLLVFTVMMVGAGLSVPSADADQAQKKIIIFHDDVTDEARLDFIEEWTQDGVDLIMDLPFMNSMVVSVNEEVSVAQLAGDWRVNQVEDDTQISGQSVAAGDGGSGDGGSGDGGSGDGGSGDGGSGDGGSGDGGSGDGGSGDGGSGDGGSGDGGSGDGGSGDGGSGDGGSGDGGSGDGGSGDGGSGDGGSFQLPSFMTHFRDLKNDEYPWGTISSYGQEFDPNQKVDEMYSVSSWVLDDVLDDIEDERIKVAIFDTGIDADHPRLSNFVKGGFDTLKFKKGIPADDNGHGTHVAGTLCGNALGVAPGVDLYMVKVLDENAEGKISSLAMGLQWALMNQMDIVSMSLAYKEDLPVVRLAVRMASRAGLIMVAAVGNHFNWEDNDTGSGDGGSAVIAGDGGSGDGGSGDGGSGDGGSGDGGSGDGGSGDGGSGDGGSGDGGSGDGGSGDGGSGDGGSGSDVVNTNPFPVMYPAKYPEVIAVSAHTVEGHMAAFSNDGPEIDIWAPGVDIVSTVPGDGFASASGTSMATPHVTGTIALMLAANPSLDHDAIKNILNASADFGLLDTATAVEMTYNYSNGDGYDY